MAVLRLFASAREAAGIDRVTIPGETVGAILERARTQFGEQFASVLERSKVWRNGEPAVDDDCVTDADEIAVLPPVSGGT